MSSQCDEIEAYSTVCEGFLPKQLTRNSIKPQDTDLREMQETDEHFRDAISKISKIYNVQLNRLAIQRVVPRLATQGSTGKLLEMQASQALPQTPWNLHFKIPRDLHAH